MNEVIVLFTLGLIWIIFASVQDLRSREVANWLNFSLIVFALGFRFFYSLFSESGFGFFYQGVIGLIIFLVLGNMFYYGRVFAGGDAKLMIALGPILGFSSNFYANIKIYVLFFFIFLFSGAFYGILWSLFLSFRNKKEFKKEFSKQFKKNKKQAYIAMTLGVVLIIGGFFESLLFIVGVLIFILPYIYVYARSVDDACMIRKVKTKDLREGDWLYEDLRVGRKVIKQAWEGLSKDDIRLIRKKHKIIKIRQGIPFVPVFLISFLMLIFLWIANYIDIVIGWI